MGVVASHGVAATVDKHHRIVLRLVVGIVDPGGHIPYGAGHHDLHGLERLGAAFVPEAALLHILHPKLIPGTVGVERIGSVCGLIIDHLPHTLAEQGIGIGLVALIVGLAVRHEEFHDEYLLILLQQLFWEPL